MGHNSNWTIVNKVDGLSLGEINTVLRAGQNNPDLGSLCKHDNINPWAKYKPFRDSALYYPTASDWQTAVVAARYGFGQTESSMSYAWNAVSPEWCANYLKPRGGTYSEPYRQLDFADMTSNSTYGYDRDAVPPLKITFEAALYKANSGVEIKIDEYADSNWDADTCLAFNDVLPTTLSSYKFAVLLKYKPYYSDTTSNNLIVSKFGPANLPGSIVRIPFSANPESSDHIYSPLLATLSEGDVVTVNVGLVYENWTVPSDIDLGYVYDNGQAQSPNQYSGNLVSLNFKNLSPGVGMDSATLVVHEANSIVGLEGSVSASISKVTSSYRPAGDYSAYKTYFINTITVNLDSTGCDINSWGDRDRVNVQLFITTGPASAVYDNFYIHSSKDSFNESSDARITAISTYPPDTEFDSPGTASNEYYRILSDNPQSGGDRISVVFIDHNETVSSVVLYGGNGSYGTNQARPYVSFNSTSGQRHTITISGFAYMGNNPDAPGMKIGLDPFVFTEEV